MTYTAKGSNQFIHPFTFFVMNKLELVYNLHQNSHYTRSAKAMDALIIFLDPEIRKVISERKSYQRLHGWIQGITGNFSSTLPMTDSSLTPNEILKVYGDILLCLHVAGYFDMAKGIVPTRATKKRDLEQQLHNALKESDKL